MIVTFLAIGAFVWWLNATAVGTSGPVEIAEADTAEAGPAANQIDLAELQMQPDSLVGEEVSVVEASVASRLGEQAFWIELPNQNPFLVRLGPALVADSVQIAQAETVGLTGSVYAMSDSVLNAWIEQGVISDGQRIEAEFATHFIEASEVARQEGGDEAGDDAGEEDAQG